MKRLLVIAICVLVAALGAACEDGGGDVENTMKDWLVAYNAGDYEKCLTYMTDYGNHDTAISALEYMKGSLGDLTLINVGDVKIQDSTATATFTLKDGSGEEGPETIQFKKENGSWKMYGAWQ